MVEKGRDRDGERDQSQPEARASLEKVEKEVKKDERNKSPREV